MKVKYIEIALKYEPGNDIDHLNSLKNIIDRVLSEKGYSVCCNFKRSSLPHLVEMTPHFEPKHGELNDIEEEITFILHNTEAYYNYL